MSCAQTFLADLETGHACWLITGVAGFIGSHLLESLLNAGQEVVGLDNFSTGFPANLEDVQRQVGQKAWRRFRFIEGDIRDPATCQLACKGMDFVLHQAALGSVPRSIADPLATHLANVDGTLNLFLAARDAGVRRVVFASSSSVYGDNPDLPKVEAHIGAPLSPYALSKRITEDYAAVLSRTYGFHSIGLRYFNVFGPRQNTQGPYAAVIPLWISAMLRGEPCTVFGDGETGRDFTYVANVVQANLRAATCRKNLTDRRIFNVACGTRTTLLELHRVIQEEVAMLRPGAPSFPLRHAEARPGEIRDSLAAIGQARDWMGYEPLVMPQAGIRTTVRWFSDLR